MSVEHIYVGIGYIRPTLGGWMCCILNIYVSVGYSSLGMVVGVFGGREYTFVKIWIYSANTLGIFFYYYIYHANSFGMNVSWVVFVPFRAGDTFFICV